MEVLLCLEEMEPDPSVGEVPGQEEVLVEVQRVVAGWEEHGLVPVLVAIVFAPVVGRGLLIGYLAPVMT